MAYTRLRLSVETYPFVSVAQAPGFIAEGIVSRWTSFGMGTRTSYRIKPFLAATMDVMSSFIGGPMTSETAELGLRLGPDSWSHKVHPFLDARVGYMHAYDSYLRPIDNSFAFPTQQGLRGSRYSQGMGGVVGAGVDFSLTQSLSLTTATSVMRNHMTAYRYSGALMTADGNYWITSYRYTLGVKYNPVRLMRPDGAGDP